MRKDFSVAMMPFIKKTVGRREGRKQGSLARTTIYQWWILNVHPTWASVASQHNLRSWEMHIHVCTSSHFWGSVSHMCILRNYIERILSLYNFLEHSKICFFIYTETSSFSVVQFWGLVKCFLSQPSGRLTLIPTPLLSLPASVPWSCPQPMSLETRDFLKPIIILSLN